MEQEPIELDEVETELPQLPEAAEKFAFFKLFTGIFARHTAGERREVFLAGLEELPPQTHTAVPRPWLFARVFLVMAATFALLYAGVRAFGGVVSVPGLIILGAFTVPVSLAVFFFEANMSKNVPLFSAIKMFFVGGATSILITLLLDSLLNYTNGLDYGGAVLTGVVEETSKILVVLYYVRRHKVRDVFGGLAVGACVGAGFAAFESAGYSFLSMFLNVGLPYPAILYQANYMADSLSAMLDTTFLRCMLAPGGHIVWAAISGAALCLMRKRLDEGEGRESGRRVLAPLAIFLLPIALHSIWNMPFTDAILPQIYFIPLVLTAIAWAVVARFFAAAYRDEAGRRAAQTEFVRLDAPHF